MIALGLARVPPPAARCPAGHGGRASGAAGERWGCQASVVCGVCLRQEGWATPVWPQGAGSQEDFLSPPTHPSSHCSILSHPSHPSHLISSHPIPCFTLSHPISCVLSLPILSHSISSHSFPSVLFCPIPFPLLYPVSTCPAPVVLSHAIQFPHLLAISSCSACPVLSCPVPPYPPPSNSCVPVCVSG